MRFHLQAGLGKSLGLLLLAAVLALAGHCQMNGSALLEAANVASVFAAKTAGSRPLNHQHPVTPVAHNSGSNQPSQNHRDCCDTDLKACCQEGQVVLQDKVEFRFWSVPFLLAEPTGWAGRSVLGLGFSLFFFFGQTLPPPEARGLVQQKTQLSC